MDKKQALTLEVLAILSQRDNAKFRYALPPHAMTHIRREYEEAAEILARSPFYQMDDPEGPWRLICFPDRGVHIDLRGGGNLRSWTTVPDQVLVDAYPLLSRFLANAVRHESNRSSDMARSVAHAVSETGLDVQADPDLGPAGGEAKALEAIAMLEEEIMRTDTDAMREALRDLDALDDTVVPMDEACLQEMLDAL